MDKIEKIKIEVCELYSIDADSLSPINNQGELFYCRKDKEEYVLRISGRKTLEEQEAETEWVHFLFENGINVSNPILSNNNRFVETIQLDSKELSAVMFSRAEGRIAKISEWNEELFERCGEVIGKMHNLSEQNNLGKNKIEINDWFVQDEYDFRKYLPKNQKKLLRKCQDIIDEIKKLPKKNNTYGNIHSDINQGNFFINDNDITIFDFQDCEQHYFINDLAIIIYFAFYNSYNGDDIESYIKTFTRSLFKGYQKVRKLDPFWVRTIPLFMRLRELLSLNIFYCYDDVDKLEDDYKILINMYKKNIEFDIRPLEVDFESLI